MSDGLLVIIPTAPDLPHPLGRRGIWHDPRNRDHPALVRPPARSLTPYKAWATGSVFDQGHESSCTAQAATGLLRTSPYAAQVMARERATFDTAAERFALYQESQRFDPWPGEGYDGTSTDAPFKVLRNRGVIDSWRWLFGEAQLREWLTWYGPAVIGINWYDLMFETSAIGLLRVGGSLAGGHAIRVVQFTPGQFGGAYRLVNSWGRAWGVGGRAWITVADMQRLLDQEQGDAVTIGVAPN